MSFYSVKEYSSVCYRTIRFPNMPYHAGPGGVKVKDRINDEKLEQSRIRARRTILEIALCNDWDFFVSFTVSPDNFDRYELFPIQNTLTQWFRDQRKKLGYENLAYALVPEKHEDGAWHLHGFMSGIPDSALSDFVPGIHPQKLVDKGYLNWGDLSYKFGFCSLGVLRDPIRAAFYCCTYFSKDAMKNVTAVGAHMYICSQGLRRCQQLGFSYGTNLVLDAQIQHNGIFCDVGWFFGTEHVYYDCLDDWCTSPLFDVPNVVGEIEADYEQCRIPDFPISSFYSPYGGIV